MSSLSRLPNIGKVLAANLLAVGIETPQQLREIGAKEAFRRIRSQRDAGACLHMLYGLQGAVLGIPDTQLPADVKQELRAFLANLAADRQS